MEPGLGEFFEAGLRRFVAERLFQRFLEESLRLPLDLLIAHRSRTEL
ncbi:MAG TPA: hypothetical protein VFS54_10945 [Solirubrobacterales bacterium]|nr:hypothetical protein [Solirubrobacterales bacterium]